MLFTIITCHLLNLPRSIKKSNTPILLILHSILNCIHIITIFLEQNTSLALITHMIIFRLSIDTTCRPILLSKKLLEVCWASCINPLDTPHIMKIKIGLSLNILDTINIFLGICIRSIRRGFFI